MTHAEITKALNIIRPGAEWALRGDTYDGLDWQDDIQSKPTEAEIFAAIGRPSADDVRAECQRRIIALTGAENLIACMIKQSNANMRANKLNDKRLLGGSLTPQEDAEAQGLRALAASIERLREKSNIMEPNPPSDYRDDSHWI